MTKVSPTQAAALVLMAARPEGRACGYALKVNGAGNTGTLAALHRKGLVRTEPQLGDTAFPHFKDYWITAEGRKVALRHSGSGMC